MSVTIRGLDGLLRQLEQLKVELAVKALATAARRAFQPVLDDAKRLVPRDSGALADSLRIKVEKPSAGDTVIKVGIMVGGSRLAKQSRVAAAAFGEAQSKELPPARRWHFIELGTSKMAAHPYLRPALEQNASAVVELLKGELQKQILKAVNR
jgi:HK97 gp10 family phage protein